MIDGVPPDCASSVVGGTCQQTNLWPIFLFFVFLKTHWNDRLLMPPHTTKGGGGDPKTDNSPAALELESGGDMNLYGQLETFNSLFQASCVSSYPI